jgi:hypothetical protein
MSVYFRGTSAGQLGATFAREGARTNQRALRQMRRVAKLIMQQSIANSPVDWKGPKGNFTVPGHELEKAHKIQEQFGGRGRIEATVSVGGMVGSVNVDLYAEWIHEGSYRLGRASLAKAGSGPKNKVGPQFLERAMDEHAGDFDPILDEIMKGLMG